jgi:hypothetical protein
MLKRVLNGIKNAFKFMVPIRIYLYYYSKKHDDEYKKLMIKVNAKDHYINDPEVKKDFFRSLNKDGLPVRFYSDMGFYEIKDQKQRDSYVGPGKLTAFRYGVNTGPSAKILDDKVMCLKHFSKYVNREWLDMRETSFEEFADFCVRHPQMIIKNAKGYGGKGTHIFDASSQSEEGLRAAYSKYTGAETVIEELICQKGFMHDLNPASVNTYRICTMRIRNRVEIFQCYVNMGNGTACVDNGYSGGMFAPVDAKTGEVLRDPVDIEWEPYHEHPVSGIVMKGRILPYWDKVRELALAVADEVPDIYYLSLDVAVNDDGTLYLIEGNSCGDGFWCKDFGEWPVYEKVLKNPVLWLKYRLNYNKMIKFHIEELLTYLS